ncbi:MAG: hypothetical protein ACFFGZ_07920 [Candidatus Thorarchaeota archaeon]
MSNIMSIEGHEHLHLPILTVSLPSKMVAELFGYLTRNKAVISGFDERFGKKTGYISLEKRSLYVSVEQGADTDLVNFYEFDDSFHPMLLRLILHFVQEKRLHVIINRIGKLSPHDFPPLEDLAH